MDNINELFKSDSKIPQFFKYVIYIFKKLFCILTIKNNKICILPYKKVSNKVSVIIITKILLRLTTNIVLSNYLSKIETLNKQLNNNRIHICKGNILPYYLIYNFIEYICNIRNENITYQEIFILVNNLNELTRNCIIDISQKFKRVNIVTYRIKDFNRISDYLEKLGIAITVTNNKRKSLSKAKFIVNFDFDADMLSVFNINTHAIIIEMDKKITIKSKLFNGINILDFEMIYDDKTTDFDIVDYRKFDKNIMYEQSLIGKRYDAIIRKIEEDNVKIVNLIGKNGIINNKEYLKI